MSLSQIRHHSMLLCKSGGHLLSHIVSNIVPSAAYVLTIVFGMGTGVSHKRITTGNFLSYLRRLPSTRLFADASVSLMDSRPLIHTRSCLSADVNIASIHSLVCALGSQQPNSNTTPTLFLRKEVIQPHLPIRLPCYDFTPVISPAFGGSFQMVRSPTSGITDSHGVTGGVYKTRERIHRDMLIRDY